MPAARVVAWLAAALFALLQAGEARAVEDQGRLRLIIETDAGGDPDDEQSLVRFLLYACEWDVEAIIANRAVAREGENLNPERTGLGIVQAQLRAYGACWPNLVKHDPRYPPPDVLMHCTLAGYDDTDAAVERIVAIVDVDDPRPVWYADWGTDSGGAKNNLRRALDRVLRERGPEGYARFKGRLRLASADAFGEHTYETQPAFPLWVDTFRPERDGRRWYHTFSKLTATAGGFDVERDLRTGHGPLGALYPLNTTHPQKEGDTMTFLYLVPTGMNDPAHPEWGSWAGRYGPRDDAEGRPYYWADAPDMFAGTNHRDNTLVRWAAAIQRDFAARADWCVADEYADANHRPLAVLNDDRSQRIVHYEAHPRGSLKLSAAGSSDPDGDRLTVRWILYPEPGDGHGVATLREHSKDVAVLTIGACDRVATLHVLLEVTDPGSPPLVAYRRTVVTVKP